MTSARDAAAFKKIYDTRAERLVTASGRAEKWIAGLTALVTVLTTAMVVKGPENFAKAEGDVRTIVLILVIAGGVCLSAGILLANSAAFGALFKRSDLDEWLDAPPKTADGAADELDRRVGAAAGSARDMLRAAVVTTSFGMVALTAAIGFSWFATEKAEAPNKTCATVDGATVVFSGDVKLKTGILNLIECPK